MVRGVGFGRWSLGPYLYEIFDLKTLNPSRFWRTFTGYYPSLLAFNLNSIIISAFLSVKNLIQSLEAVESYPYLYTYIPIFIILLVFMPFLSMAVFSPVWFLNDAGIVYSMVERVRETEQPVEGRTVGGWFRDYLKGYAGISVLFSYYPIIYVYHNVVGAVDLLALFVSFSAFVMRPFFTALAMIPAFILMDVMHDHRVQHIRRVAANLGISKEVEFLLEEKI